ncbi:MAG: hypothetical protein J6B91_02060 [Prevotella sp.]|nr:hypothetical protein [Prevotella sp.]
MKAVARRVVLCVAVLLSCAAHAQSGISKDATFAFSFGVGAEWLSEAYSPRGLSLAANGRFYTSDRVFVDMWGHWGTHDGSTSVVRGDGTADIDDHRDCLVIAVGPGCDVYQNGNNTLSIYVRMLAGYGLRHSEYDDFDPHYGDNGRIVFGREETRKGLAAVGGVGIDMRFRRWLLTPSADAIYAGNRWSVSASISVGYFY